MGQSGVVVVVFHDECPGSKAPQFCKSWAESDKSWIITIRTIIEHGFDVLKNLYRVIYLVFDHNGEQGHH